MGDEYTLASCSVPHTALKDVRANSCSFPAYPALCSANCKVWRCSGQVDVVMAMLRVDNLEGVVDEDIIDRGRYRVLMLDAPTVYCLGGNTMCVYLG